MSLVDFQAALVLRNNDEAFYALIMAAMMRADTENAAMLRAMWPKVWDETQARWNAPGGALAGEDFLQGPLGVLGRAPCTFIPALPKEEVPARGNDDPRRFFYVNGALLCDDPIEGITQDLQKGASSDPEGLDGFYGGHRFFVGESMNELAAQRIAVFLGGYLALP